MFDLAHRLHIHANEDGLALHLGSRDASNDYASIAYRSGKVQNVPSTGSGAGKGEVKSAEVYGLVGLLDLVSTQYLIVITQREEVAQIRGHAIYAVRDVGLIPLTSQAEAEKAIAVFGKGQKNDHTSAAEEQAEESEVEDEDAVASETDGEQDAEVVSNQDGTNNAAAEKDTPQSQSRYSRFAKLWFGKRTNVGPQQSQASGNKEDPAAQSGEETSSEPHGSSTVEKAEPETASEPDQNDIAEPQPAEPTTASKKNKSAIGSLTPRIVKTARLYFGTSGFYFAYDHDISATLTQKSTQAPAPPLWQRFDALYFWNRKLIAPFIAAGRDELVLPLMQGFVGQRAFSITKTESSKSDVVAGAAQDTSAVLAAQSIPSITPSDSEATDGHEFLLTLISRRAVTRAGLRFMRRGVDDDGNVANHVETEQILSRSSWAASEKAYSLVQLRGSVPLHFTQGGYSIKPPPVMFGSEATNQTAFKKHLEKLAKRYGEIQIASLVDKHGAEASVGEAFEHHTNHLNENGGVDGKKVGFEWFDFHTACKGMNFQNVSILMDSIESILRAFGSNIRKNDRNIHVQSGVVRTNCMDCLDRSNVVQSEIASWAVQQQLQAMRLNVDLRNDPTTQWFNTLWADNGDYISKQYAGTAALKGDFTRTRKRNWTGALSDMTLSLGRYYNNIFSDFFLQTCIDFFLGNAGPEIFDEFETDMMNKDYALNMRRIRQNAIDACIRIVLEDPKATLKGGWTLSCPRDSNTLRTLPFEECVVLLTDAAFYLCRFDWNTEKVAGFERVPVSDITEIWRGAYITSALGPTNLDESKNVGFALRYKPSGKTVVRTNTRSLQNEDDARDEPEVIEEPDNKQDNDSKKVDAQEKKGDTGETSKILAFKALPLDSTASRNDNKETTHMSELELVKHICDQLSGAAARAIHQDNKGADQSVQQAPVVEERDVISIADARKGTGYVESISYSLKRLVWS